MNALPTAAPLSNRAGTTLYLSTMLNVDLSGHFAAVLLTSLGVDLWRDERDGRCFDLFELDPDGGHHTLCTGHAGIKQLHPQSSFVT